MPDPWRDKFVNAGKVVRDLTIAEYTHYFCQQEKRSLRKKNDNSQAQRYDVAKCRTSSGSPK
jgi:hypothetical protein